MPEARRFIADSSSQILKPSPKTSTKHEVLLGFTMPLPHRFGSGVPDAWSNSDVVTGGGVVVGIAVLLVEERSYAAVVQSIGRVLEISMVLACGLVPCMG